MEVPKRTIRRGKSQALRLRRRIKRAAALHLIASDNKRDHAISGEITSSTDGASQDPLESSQQAEYPINYDDLLEFVDSIDSTGAAASGVPVEGTDPLDKGN